MAHSIKLNVLALKSVTGTAGQRTVVTIEGMPGLRLYVEPSGTRTWYFEYKRNTQKKKLRLGNAEYVTLQDVREKALALRREIELGLDPRAAQIVEKQKDEEQAFTLAVLVGRWLEANDHLRTIGNRRRVMEASVLPILGHRVVQDITRRDVIGLVDKVASRGAKAAAD